MKVSVKAENNQTILEVSGRLDAGSSNELESVVLKEIENNIDGIVFDFSNLDYISSSGLRVLLITVKKLKPQNKKVVLCGLKTHISEVLEIAGFKALFEITENC